MAGGGERRALAVDFDAKCGGVAEGRLEFRSDLGCFGLRELRCGQRLMIGNGDQLDEKGERNEERRERRA